jgi:hypothetical protein
MWPRKPYSQFLRSMAAWGGNPNPTLHRRNEEMKNSWKIFIMTLAAGLLVQVYINFQTRQALTESINRQWIIQSNCAVENELQAYKLISQELGVVRINESDGKKYVSFAFRAKNQLPETPEFIRALRAIIYLPDVRGIHLDGIPLTTESLFSLQSIESLECITVRGTGLDKEKVAIWESLLPNIRKSPIDVWLTYDADHP